MSYPKVPALDLEALQSTRKLHDKLESKLVSEEVFLNAKLAFVTAQEKLGTSKAESVSCRVKIAQFPGTCMIQVPSCFDIISAIQLEPEANVKNAHLVFGYISPKPGFENDRSWHADETKIQTHSVKTRLTKDNSFLPMFLLEFTPVYLEIDKKDPKVDVDCNFDVKIMNQAMQDKWRSKVNLYKE